VAKPSPPPPTEWHLNPACFLCTSQAIWRDIRTASPRGYPEPVDFEPAGRDVTGRSLPGRRTSGIFHVSFHVFHFSSPPSRRSSLASALPIRVPSCLFVVKTQTTDGTDEHRSRARNGAETEANHGIHENWVHHGGMGETEPERKNHQWTLIYTNACRGDLTTDGTDQGIAV